MVHFRKYRLSKTKVNNVKINSNYMKLSIGIIGAGRMGERHALAYEKITNANLIGFADVIPEKSQKLAEKFNKKNYSIDEILENNDIDAVHVCTPNNSHFEISLKAIRSGKHVLIEKPMALKLEDCDIIISEAKKFNVNLMIGHTYRYYPSSLKVKELLDSGIIGEVKLVLGYGLDPGQISGKGKTPDWALSSEMGGGVFIDAIHGVDLFRYWFDTEISQVFVPIMDKIHDEFSAEQMGMATIIFKNNIVATIMPVAPTWGIRENVTKIVGKKGVISVSYGEEVKVGKETWQVYDFDYRSKPPSFEHNLQGFINEINEFIDSIQEKRSPQVTGEEGKKNLQVILSMYESYIKKKIIDISYE